MAPIFIRVADNGTGRLNEVDTESTGVGVDYSQANCRIPQGQV